MLIIHNKSLLIHSTFYILHSTFYILHSTFFINKKAILKKTAFLLNSYRFTSYSTTTFDVWL